MNPLARIKAAPWIAAVVLAALLALMTNLYLNERDELATVQAKYDSFVSVAKTLGDAAQREKVAKDAEHARNLDQIRKEHEAKQPTIEAHAVANYKRAHPGLMRQCPGTSADSRTVPGDGTGVSVDDDAQPELVPVEHGFIQECAADANKVSAWQGYCRLNQCPVED